MKNIFGFKKKVDDKSSPHNVISNTLSATINALIEQNEKDNKLRLLIADDAKINRYVLNRYLCKIFKPEIINIDECGDGLTAIKMCSEKFYDIVFMDIKMPGMNGDKASHKIRERNIDTIIIGVTGQIEIKETIPKEDIDEILEKPIILGVLRTCLEKYINKRFFND